MTAIVRIAVLGPVEVTVDGRSVDRGAAVSADRIAEAVWGDDLPAEPTAALHNQIARLRAALAPAGDVIEASPGRYALRETVVTDIHEFTHLLTAAREQTDDGSPSALFGDALDLWRGPAYEELDVDPARSARARLDELRLAAEEDRATAVLRAGRPQDAVALLEALCSAEPLREHARLVLAEALAAAGRRADALRTLNDLRRRLLSELGLDPSPSVALLERAIIESEPAAQVAGPVDIPGPLSPVFGRDADVAQVDSLIDTTRLLTLVGPGGVGKTTLAMLVAQRAVGRFPHGAVVVDLTSARDDGDVAPVVARALGIDRQGNVAWVLRISEALAGRELLVVLDNAEHVVDGVARLLDENVRRTRVRWLVTSRQSLSIPGERVWPVEPLVVVADPANPAVALFSDRAAAARPDWTVSTSVTVVARICAGLDGLPLAIELAAAQLRYRTLEEVATGVDRPLDLLEGPTRSHVRHQGLRELLDWSYRLLDPVQQIVFERLAVFSDGFTVGTAHDACRELVADISTLEHILHALVDRSLLRRHDRRYGSRYQILATMRDFALERLAPPSLDAGRDACAEAIVSLLERGAGSVFTEQEREWVDVFDDERANMLAAHRHLIERSQVERSARLAKSAYLIAFPRGRADVAVLPDEVLTALRRSGRQDDGVGSTLPELLGLAADAAVVRGDHEAAQNHIARGRALGTRPADDRFCVFVEADLALLAGDVARAAELYDAAQAGLTMHGEDALAAWAASSAALARSYGGHPDDHVGAALQAFERADATGSASARAFCRYVLAELIAPRDLREANHQLQAAVADAESVGATFVAGLARLSLATTSTKLGETSAAIEQYLTLIELWHRLGNWTQQWNTVQNLVTFLTDNGRHAESSTLLAAVSAHAPVAAWGSNAQEIGEAVESNRDALGPQRHTADAQRGASMTAPEVLEFVRFALTRLLEATAQRRRS